MIKKSLPALALIGLLASPAQAQFSVEARGVAVVPTFKIADAAKVGPGFGAGVGYLAGDKIRLMLDGDVGYHGTKGQEMGKINTYHLMGKVGYDLYTSDKVTVTVNLGAGLVQFGGDLAESFTYPAINAGAKIAIALSEQFDLLLSPQGDIAFTKEADIGTKAGWVWPFGLGLRAKF